MLMLTIQFTYISAECDHNIIIYKIHSKLILSM